MTKKTKLKEDLANKEQESISEGKEKIGHEDDQQSESTHEEPKELNLQQEIADLKDKYLRAEAEVQNIRRISDQQVTKARLYGIETFAKSILSVGDNLERALDSLTTNQDIKAALEGRKLTLKDYEKSLESSGITYINPINEKFNAAQHQAMSMVEDDKLEENSIKQVIQKGYLLYDRVLRPAMVVVSKKPKDKKNNI